MAASRVPGQGRSDLYFDGAVAASAALIALRRVAMS
jgi:hypothetical protein